MKLVLISVCACLLLAACQDPLIDDHEALIIPDITATNFTNESYGHLPMMGSPENPVQYYQDRSQAFGFAFDGEWIAAQPLLQTLVTQYTDDGDVWYLLGLSYLQTENWADAITALENTISLGTVLNGVPTGSSPSNYIMIRIAQAYAALGDDQNSILWAEKAFSARYDDRPFLGSKDHFSSALSTSDYQQFLGTYLEDGLSRDASWQADLDYLVSELRRLHVNLHNHMSAQEFQQRALGIKARIPQLTDQEIVFEFMELVGGLGSGHNLIIPTNGAKGAFKRLPVEFYWFSDGLFIVEASQDNQALIGSKIISIGDVPINEALAKTATLNARDNEMQHLWLSPYYISLPEVLTGLGIINQTDNVPLTLINSDGVTEHITLSGTEWTFNGFPKLPKLTKAESPLYLAKSDQLFWLETLPQHNATFVQFNWVAERKEQTLKAFSQDLIDAINNSDFENLILDLRHNPGGNGSILPPLLRALVYFEAAKPEGKLYIITGRGTFSAAHNLLTNLNRITNAVIVGEPSGSRPNAISEAGWFKLPYSGLMGLTSSQFHQPSTPEDHRIWIAPHLPVSLSSAEYFSGTDPALEAIYSVIAEEDALN